MQSFDFSKPTKILIACPNYSGRVVVETIVSLIDAIKHHTARYPHHTVDIKFQVRNFCTYAAEKLCERALAGYDYMVFWGDDILAPPDVLERLLRHGKDIVASTVFARSAPFGFYAFDDKLRLFHVKRLNTGLQKCRAAGTGLMLIKSSVFEGLSKPWWIWPNDESTDVDKEWCLKVEKEKGTSIWVDTDLMVGHLDFKPNVINHETHKAWIKSVVDSGVMNHPEFKNHPDYKKLEAMIGSQ